MSFKNTDDNRNTLARQVVYGMDGDDLIEAMIDRLVEDYHHDDECFQEAAYVTGFVEREFSDLDN